MKNVYYYILVAALALGCISLEVFDLPAKPVPKKSVQEVCMERIDAHSIDFYERVNDLQIQVNHITARLDESFQNHQFSEDENERLTNEFRLITDDLHKVVDANQKRIETLETLETLELPPVEEVVPLPPVVEEPEPEPVSEPEPVIAPPETFAQFAAREYRGVSWVEAGRNDVTVNHMVNVHHWDREEVKSLTPQQLMKCHGASHSGQVDNLRRRYKAKYGL